ncbi:hypothetical protein EBU94_03295, partial [bacterium]|nr:hypothetical protein [bacterium]
MFTNILLCNNKLQYTMIGSFKNPQDEKRQMDRYFERLRLKQKLIKAQEMVNQDTYTSLGAPKVSPVGDMTYQNIQQELADNTLQLQKAQQNLRNFFKYPQDAKATLDLILETYTAAQFNQVLPEFILELKGVKDITPSYFANQFDRFMIIKKSRGDNLVQIGVNDNPAKISNLQKVANIIGVLDKSEDYKILSAGQRRELKEIITNLSEPVVDNEGLEDVFATQKRQEELLKIERDIEFSKKITDEENEKIVEEVNNRSEEWKAAQREIREAEGLPDVPISVPTVLTTTWVKDLRSEKLAEKREDVSNKIIEHFLGEKIRRGKQVQEKLKERFREKIERQEEFKQAELEQLRGQVSSLREQKAEYEDFIQPIIEENTRLEEQRSLNQELRDRLVDIEKSTGAKINSKTGVVKIPRNELQRTKEFVMKGILGNRDIETLTRKEQQELSVIDRSNTNELASYMTKIIKSQLREKRYFEKEKPLRKVPTFAEYLDAKEKKPKARISRPVISSEMEQLEMQTPEIYEVKEGMEVPFELQEVPSIFKKRRGRPKSEKKLTPQSESEPISLIEPLEEFPKQSGTRGRKPAPRMTDKEFNRLLKIGSYSESDIRSGKIPENMITEEEYKQFIPQIEKLDTSQTRELYRYFNIPEKENYKTIKLPKAKQEIIKYLGSLVDVQQGKGISKTSKQSGGFIQYLLPILGNRVTGSVLGNEQVKSKKRGRPKKITMEQEVKSNEKS